MKKLRIGQIAPLNLPIPPPKYGGTERIIYSLCEGLTKKGHEVILFGAGDSKTKARLFPLIPRSLWAIKRKKEATPYFAYEMARIAKEAKRLKLDILHDHLGPWALALYGQINIPILHTLHVPLNKDRAWAYRKLKANLVSISNNQRKVAPNLNYVATIYNGIDVKNFPFSGFPKNHLLFAGELAKRKGILEAIKVAKVVRMKLIIAGRVPSREQKMDFQFFKTLIQPQFKNKNITYLGELSEKNLNRVYSHAKAVLFPIKWEEPFGLVMIESMASGTPVIAFRRGSVPEVIKNGKTGFIVRNINEMAEAVKKIDRINRAECRRWVEEKFSVEKMIDDYERLFFKLVEK